VTTTDARLVASARDGDLAAFTKLVHRHQDRAYRTSLRILRDPSDAEDATQDAFVSAFRSLPGYRGDAAFSTWLYRIVVNASYAVSRRRSPTGDLGEVADDLPASGVGPADVATAGGLRAALLDALAALPADHRVVFVLRELEQLSVSETADVLEVTATTVSTRLHRARQGLIDQLGSWHPQDAGGEATSEEPS
jgi:RNA polymerase sigma-70 factor (ECF subfamily)